MQDPLILFTLLIAAGVGAQWIAARLRLPALLLLLLTGIGLGPVGGILRPDELFGEGLDPLIKIAVAIVLFEGGLALNIKEARHVGHTLWALILSGLVLGFGLTTLIAWQVAGLDLATSTALGGILVVTGPTVILPMLRSARVAMRPAALLKWEGIVNDPFGALLAYLVLRVATIQPTATGASDGITGLIFEFLLFGLLAAGIGASCGLVLGRALSKNWIAEHLRVPIILAAVLVVYASCETIQHESGLLGVTLMGLVLANLEDTPIDDIQHFKEQMTTLLVAILFVVLSAQLDIQSLGQLAGPPILVIIGVVFVVRPLVAMAATFRSDLPWQERVFVGWIAPRGVVAAAVAGAFSKPLQDAGFADADLLVPIVFGVIILTVTLHGLTIRPLARRLGLAATQGAGVLIVGASIWASSLAQTLVKAGAFVVLADTRYRRVSRARVAGLEVHHGDVRSEDVTLELPMERINQVFAATDDDAYNSLVCLHFQREIGRDAVLSLTPQKLGSADGGAVLTGNFPWGEAGTYREITRRFWLGQTFKVTTITETFDWDDLREKNSDALFLFYVADAKLRAVAEMADPPAGAKVVYLT